jgi:hypothetical protein
MAVPEQTPYIEYDGNGVSKVFPLTFDCEDSDHLIVKVNDEVPVVGAWSLIDEKVVFINAPAIDSKIVIQRNTPTKRSTTYNSYDNSFRPVPVNSDFDTIWRKLQELGVTNWLTDTDIKNLGVYVNSLNDETRDDFYNSLGNLEKNTNAMLEEAIANGAVSALAITTVDSISDLDSISTWDGRTVFVKEIGNYKYDSTNNVWSRDFITDKQIVNVESIEQLDEITKWEGRQVYLKSIKAGKNEGGGQLEYKSEYADINNGYILNGWVYLNLKYLTPEIFGYDHAEDADQHNNFLAFKNMLYFIKEGGVIELKPGATYYNYAPNGSFDSWNINKDGITVVGNGATITRRKTSEATAILDANLAALKVTGDSCTLLAPITIDGGEDYADIVDVEGDTIASGNYARGYSSSHALYVAYASNFTALNIVAKRAVFSMFVDHCESVRISGRGDNSGQRYPLLSSDLQLGSGIKISNSTDFVLDLQSNYSGYAGIEVEPNCSYGIVRSVARNPVYFGVIFHEKSTDCSVDSVTYNALLGASLRIGRKCIGINGQATANKCRYGLLLEPGDLNDGTDDIAQCNLTVISRDSEYAALHIVDKTALSGGKVKDSAIRIRSINDGTTNSMPSLVISNSSRCQFDVGVSDSYKAFTCDHVYDSRIDIAYFKNIAATDPMYFSENNAVDLNVKIGNVKYELVNANGIVKASSLSGSQVAVPVSNLQTFDVRTDQLIFPTLPTTNAATLMSGVWVDTANSNVLKKRTS